MRTNPTGIKNTLIQDVIISFIAQGFSRKEIAGLLKRSGKTIQHHIHNFRQRTGIITIRDMVKWGVGMGYADLEQFDKTKNQNKT